MEETLLVQLKVFFSSQIKMIVVNGSFPWINIKEFSYYIIVCVDFISSPY